jgi:excisionase family DNA binding protein
MNWTEKGELAKSEEVIVMTREYYSNDQLPCMLNADKIAKYLEISRAGAYELMHSEGFPLIRIGKRMIVPRDKFLEWVDNQTAR